MSSKCYLGQDHHLFREQWKDEYDHAHREDGPAIIYKTGLESWYLRGIYYTHHRMPLNLFLAYVKWEYRKKHGN